MIIWVIVMAWQGHLGLFATGIWSENDTAVVDVADHVKNVDYIAWLCYCIAADILECWLPDGCSEFSDSW